jgi:hypothetical protein
MPISTIWVSFDLGIRGDYEGLYAWLDTHQATECGDSVAVIKYNHENSSQQRNIQLADKIKSDLKKAVSIDKRTRIYLIYRDPATGNNRGVFLFGGRRAAIWSGYAPSESGTADIED